MKKYTEDFPPILGDRVYFRYLTNNRWRKGKITNIVDGQYQIKGTYSDSHVTVESYDKSDFLFRRNSVWNYLKFLIRDK